MRRVSVEATARAVVELARGAEDLAGFRRDALEALRRCVPFDVAILHELSPRVPLERAALVEVDPAWLASTLASWDAFAVLFGALLADARANGDVALASRAFARRGDVSRAWSRRVARPLRVSDLAMLHLVVRGRVVSAAVLGRRRAAEPFSELELTSLAQLAPFVSVCDAWMQQRAGAPAGVPLTVRCVDGRLTPRQREVVEQVALGHSDREVGEALGVSPNTVRNLLVSVRARLGAANRAEVVHRAVFR